MKSEGVYDPIFRPFLRLLDPIASFQTLARQEGYTDEIGRRWRVRRYRVLRYYLADLEAEFNRLFSAATPYALADVQLAVRLADARKRLSSVGRRLRWTFLLQRFAPVPPPDVRITMPGSGIPFRADPRNESLEALLNSMNTIRQTIGGQMRNRVLSNDTLIKGI